MNENKRIESRFTQTLNKLLRGMEAALETAATPRDVVNLLTRYSQSPEYKKWCDNLALTVTTGVNTGVSKTWRQAAQKAGRGSEIYAKILQDLKSPIGGAFSLKLRENADLIKTFPTDVASTLNAYIAQETGAGRRSGDILKDLLKQYPDTAKSRLNLIARTEVSKTQTALVQSRAQTLGLDWYVWQTSEDARVRKAHSHMQGVLVKWSDPPSPEALDPKGGEKPYGKYHAGDTFNCRCYPEPVVNIDYVDFPAKVYYGGVITKMTRARFEKITDTAPEPLIPQVNQTPPGQTVKPPANIAPVGLTNGVQGGIMNLPDMQIVRSLGAMARNYDIVDLDGLVYHFAEGTKIQDVEVFAGKGTKNPLHDGVAEGLTREFGGKSEEWQHVKGVGYLMNDSESEAGKAKVHWFQEKNAGKFKFKVKEWLR